MENMNIKQQESKRFMGLTIAKAEAFLRICAILFLVLTALLVGFDTQTKVIIYLRREVTYKDLKALPILIYVASAGATYNLLQLSRCFSNWQKKRTRGYYLFVAWLCYALDQLAVYLTFAATSAVLEHSVLVLTGAKVFQWMKWCNKFTRFCFQIGGSLVTAYISCVLMAIVSFISAFNLFRLYSPNHPLVLKTK